MKLKLSIFIIVIALMFPILVFGQHKSQDLGVIFAKRYINISMGLVSSTSKLTYSKAANSIFPKTTDWNKSFSIGFGYRLNLIKSNFYLEYNLINNRYTDHTIFTRNSTGMEDDLTMMIFHWVHEFGVKKYFGFYNDRVYLTTFGGLNITTTRAVKPNSPFSYDATEDNWFRYTSQRIKPGCYVGIGINFKLGKRVFIFGQYKVQTEFSDNTFIGEIQYRGLYGDLTDYYKSKVLPYNQMINVGISLSLENSAFYK